MKVIKDNDELQTYIKDGVIKFNDDIKCDFDINVNADIDALDIHAWNINAHDIDANNIHAYNIEALDINARNIHAQNISAGNINAEKISYFAFCIANISLKCESIEGRRSKSIHKCLDKEIEFIKRHTIKIDGKEIKLSEESFTFL